jgi:hypothetical protein
VSEVSARAEMVGDYAKLEIVEESVCFEVVEEIEKRGAREANSLQSVSLENKEHLL